MTLPAGRKALWVEILDRLSDGESLRSVCRSNGMPSHVAVMQWVRGDQELADQYAQAMQARAQLHADEIVELADQTTPENAHAQRVKIDARKWVASKLLPRVYGDRVQIDQRSHETVEIRVVREGPSEPTG